MQHKFEELSLEEVEMVAGGFFFRNILSTVNQISGGAIDKALDFASKFGLFGGLITRIRQYMRPD